MSQFILLFIPKRKILTDIQIDRMSQICLEIGKLVLTGFVIGYFIPETKLTVGHFIIGGLLSLLFFILSVIFTRKGKS